MLQEHMRSLIGRGLQILRAEEVMDTPAITLCRDLSKRKQFTDGRRGAPTAT